MWGDLFINWRTCTEGARIFRRLQEQRAYRCHFFPPHPASLHSLPLAGTNKNTLPTTLLTSHTLCVLQIYSIETVTLCRSPSKVALAMTYLPCSISRDQHHSKVISSWERGKIAIHISLNVAPVAESYNWQSIENALLISASEVLGDGLGPGIWSECWPHSPTKSTQGIAQPCSSQFLHPNRWIRGKHLVWLLACPWMRTSQGRRQGEHPTGGYNSQTEMDWRNLVWLQVHGGPRQVPTLLV